MNLYRMFRVYVTLFCIPLETISKIPELVIFTFFFVTLHICEQNQLLDQKGGMNEWMNEWKCNITRKSNITQYWWDSYNVLKRTTSIKIMQFHLGKHVAEDHHGVRLSAQSSPTLLSNWLIKDAYVTQFWFEISPVFVWRMVGKEEGGGNRRQDEPQAKKLQHRRQQPKLQLAATNICQWLYGKTSPRSLLLIGRLGNPSGWKSCMCTKDRSAVLCTCLSGTS